MRGNRRTVGTLGWVELVDSMGSDASIVDAARISYGEGTRSVSSDTTLIRYLMRHRHTTPFEMPSLQFRVRCPMDCWRQWIRHRTASVNEYSTRYSEAINEMATTPPEAWREQDSTNKQGSGGTLPAAVGKVLSHDELEFHAYARELYQVRLAKGVAREQARKDLPLSTMTEAIWKMDLHNLLHFLELRLDDHAQLEIRLFASVIACYVEELFPITWQAFVDYRLQAVTLSRLEVAMIFDLFEPTTRARFDAVATAALSGRRRERDEARAKFVRLGLLNEDD